MTISFATFKKCRPKNVLLVNHLNRQTCLCKTHQNMALLLRGVLKNCIYIPAIPEEMIKEYSTDQYANKLDELPQIVNFQMWDKIIVTIGQGEGKKEVKKIQLVEKTMAKSKFISHAKTSMT